MEPKTGLEHEEAVAGQAVYSPLFLKMYDVLIVRYSNNVLWRCAAQNQLELYNDCMGRTHLDAGVGTGYYLRHSMALKQCERLTLLDMNENSLKATQENLRKNTGAVLDTLQGNVLEKIADHGFKYDSIGVNYLFHCLPGRIEEKLETVIENLKPLASEECVLFGSTILGEPDLHTPLSKAVLFFYNKRKIFTNKEDTLQGLREALEQHSDHINIEVIGAVAVFRASLKP